MYVQKGKKKKRKKNHHFVKVIIFIFSKTSPSFKQTFKLRFKSEHMFYG